MSRAELKKLEKIARKSSDVDTLTDALYEAIELAHKLKKEVKAAKKEFRDLEKLTCDLAQQNVEAEAQLRVVRSQKAEWRAEAEMLQVSTAQQPKSVIASESLCATTDYKIAYECARDAADELVVKNKLLQSKLAKQDRLNKLIMDEIQ